MVSCAIPSIPLISSVSPTVTSWLYRTGYKQRDSFDPTLVFHSIEFGGVDEFWDSTRSSEPSLVNSGSSAFRISDLDADSRHVISFRDCEKISQVNETFVDVCSCPSA